jgi:hypothetical protein
MVRALMDLVRAETGLAVASQTLHIVSKETQLPELATMTAEQRATKLDEFEGAVPTSLLDSHERFNTKTGETWDPKVVKPGDVAKYCEGHPNLWSEDKVKEVAERAGDWGGERDPLDVLGDGGNAFDIAVGNDDSCAKVGYAMSEFSTWEPPVPDATAKAFTDEIKISVVHVNDVVFPAFGHFIRWLKASLEIPKLDKADANKMARAKRLLRGKTGGYGATAEELTKERALSIEHWERAKKRALAAAAAGESNECRALVTTKSIVDIVMGNHHTNKHETTRHTRVANFMEATGTHPETRQHITKNHMLVVRTSGEFLNRVISIGEVIVRDHFKPMCDRVFKPADMGGIAGGTKYIVDGLLFKFANPAEGPYLHSYEKANKVNTKPTHHACVHAASTPATASVQ